MTKAVRFRQADVARMVRGALKGGLQPEQLQLVLQDGKVSLLPIGAAQVPSEAQDLERRMVEAFGR